MEKVNLQLLKFHPELATVWDELADKVSVSVPELADQPEGLKLKLLPFQREGLSWMRKQENGLVYILCHICAFICVGGAFSDLSDLFFILSDRSSKVAS